jgi:uncharacterized membrane protein
VLIFAMVLVLLLLVIEARRYRFFDVYRNRVRRMERNYFAQIFAPEDGTTDDWILKLGDDLRRPLFLTSTTQALSRRLRRNYCWLFLILLCAWVVKTTFIRMQENAVDAHLVTSVGEWVRNAAIGPIPGWAVIVTLTIFYGWILYAALRKPKGEGELAFGNVHV